MTGPLIVVALLVLVASYAPRYGTDSRDSQDWRYRPDSWRPSERPPGRRPIRDDLVALGRRIRCGVHALGRLWRGQERAWDACWRAHQPWRDGDRLRWRVVNGTWRLEGRVVPAGERPADTGPGSEPSSSEPAEDRRGLGLDSPG